MKRIPLYVYVAQNNPQGAAKVITGFNLRKPRNVDDLFRGLRHVIVSQGEDGLMAIAKEHPDRHLILASEPVESVVVSKKEDKSGCDGNCSCDKSNSCGNYSNLNGETKPSREEVNKAIEDKLKEKDEKVTKQDITNEVKKSIDEATGFVKNNLTQIAVGGIVLFLLIKALKPK